MKGIVKLRNEINLPCMVNAIATPYHFRSRVSMRKDARDCDFSLVWGKRTEKTKGVQQRPSEMAEKGSKDKRVEGDYHEPEYIQIVVSDPQRKGEFISYKITTSVWICVGVVLL